MPYKRQAAPTPGQIARQYHSGHACRDLFCERSTGLLAPARFEDVADLYVQQALLLAVAAARDDHGVSLPEAQDLLVSCREHRGFLLTIARVVCTCSRTCCWLWALRW